MERAKETVGERLEDAKDRLDRSGVSVNRAGEALGETAREVREVVGDVTRGAAEQAKTAMGPGNEAAPSPSGQATPPRQGDASAADLDPSPRAAWPGLDPSGHLRCEFPLALRRDRKR